MLVSCLPFHIIIFEAAFGGVKCAETLRDEFSLRSLSAEAARARQRNCCSRSRSPSMLIVSAGQSIPRLHFSRTPPMAGGMPRDTGATSGSDFLDRATNIRNHELRFREHARGSGSLLFSQPATPEWRERNYPDRKTRVQRSHEMAAGQHECGPRWAYPSFTTTPQSAANSLPKIANFAGILVHLPAFRCILKYYPKILYSCGLEGFSESARYRVRTCDPYRVKGWF